MELRRKHRNNILLILAIIIIVIFLPLLLFNNIDNSLFSSMVEYFGVMGALGGIVAIWYQMRREKNISEGEFIYSLYDGFSNNEKIKKIYHKLETCKNENYEHDPFTDEDIGHIIDYLTFFETMYLLIKRKIIDIALIDELFAYRFFIAVHNPYLQKRNLIKYDVFYKNTYRLHDMWIQYRMDKDSSIPFSQYKLDEMNKNYSQVIS